MLSFACGGCVLCRRVASRRTVYARSRRNMGHRFECGRGDFSVDASLLLAMGGGAEVRTI